MDHEDIMLSEIDQILKDKYCDSTYVRLVGKFTEAESRIVIARAGGWGWGGLYLVGILILQDEKSSGE